VSSIVDERLFREAAELANSFRDAKPFPHVVIDGFLREDLCTRLVEQFPAYDEARFRNDWGEAGKAWHENVRAMGDAFVELDEGLRSAGFLELLAQISGIPDLLFDPTYFGGGTHENLHGMELDPHIDFNLHPTTKLHRRLNLLLYLNPEWDESWGGLLELHTNPWLHPAENEVRTVAPMLNRCVVFETSDRSWHGFRRLDLPPSRRHVSRRSFALYLYTARRPSLPLIPHDITIYTDRPLPEHIRAGRTLSADDVYELECLLARRDRKLEYLYGRAIDYAQRTLEEQLDGGMSPSLPRSVRLRGNLGRIARGVARALRA